jgi:3-deoxy-D-manno-octulosonic-acid transferase
MPPPLLEKALFGFYEMAWRMIVPLLAHHQRLSDGFHQRCCVSGDESAMDLWIQSASAGEAYLTGALISELRVAGPLKILLTANTRQGLDILNQAAQEAAHQKPHYTFTCTYFPFDRPSLMERIVALRRPRVMVLVESEIWPGLIRCLKGRGVRVLIINGRLTEKSLRRYKLYPGFWSALCPDDILAISREDAHRFARLFGPDRVRIMPNMKFDRVRYGDDGFPNGGGDGRLAEATSPLVVFGSLRREEETQVAQIIAMLRTHQPDAAFALFPRHMERVSHWQKTLDKYRIPWCHRSTLKTPLPPASVVIWDRFGELAATYAQATAAFVGGSLAPLGGQNFLEPLMFGIRPVIGPHWDNFAWVGDQIVSQGLVRQAGHWRHVARLLLHDLKQPPDRQTVRRQAAAYVEQRKGGTRLAARLLASHLEGLSKAPPASAGCDPKQPGPRPSRGVLLFRAPTDNKG